MWPLSRRVLQSTMVLMLLALVLLGLAPQVCEAGHYEIRTTYFSNNTYTVIVGGRVQYCDGSISAWGTPTIYRQVLQIPCPH